jgi:hypothetical protein
MKARTANSMTMDRNVKKSAKNINVIAAKKTAEVSGLRANLLPFCKNPDTRPHI